MRLGDPWVVIRPDSDTPVGDDGLVTYCVLHDGERMFFGRHRVGAFQHNPVEWGPAELVSHANAVVQDARALQIMDEKLHTARSKLRQMMSANVLSVGFPDDWDKMDEDQQDDFLTDNVQMEFEDLDPAQLRDIINGATQVAVKFFEQQML